MTGERRRGRRELRALGARRRAPQWRGGVGALDCLCPTPGTVAAPLAGERRRSRRELRALGVRRQAPPWRGGVGGFLEPSPGPGYHCGTPTK